MELSALLEVAPSNQSRFFARGPSTRDPIAERNRAKTFQSRASCLIARFNGRQARIAAAIADKLDAGNEIPSVIEIENVYGEALDIHNCVLYTSLFDVLDEDAEGEEEDEDMEENDGGEAEGEEPVAYAFLIDDIRPKDWLDN